MINNKYNMKDNETFIITYTKKMEKKLLEMVNSFLVNVESGFLKLEINFLLILMLTNLTTWVEINIEWLKIIGRLNNGTNKKLKQTIKNIRCS